MLKFFIYSLRKEELFDDWLNYTGKGDVPQIKRKVLVTQVVLNDSCDKLCIGGIGIDGKYYQFDSYEGYHAQEWFKQNEHIHGLTLECRHVKVNPEHLIDLQ